MVEQVNAYSVSDKISSAIDIRVDDATQSKMLKEADAELKKLSAPEQKLVQFDLSLKGLLPQLAIETNVVTEDNASYDEVAQVAKSEGSSSVRGLAANYVAQDFSKIGMFGGIEKTVNQSSLLASDEVGDNQLAAVHTTSEYHGLVELLKQEYPFNSEIANKKDLSRDDIKLLLKHPEALSRDQKLALEIMNDRFIDLSDGKTIDDWSLRNFSRKGWPLIDSLPKATMDLDNTKAMVRTEALKGNFKRLK